MQKHLNYNRHEPRDILQITNTFYIIGCLILFTYLLHVNFISLHYFSTIAYNPAIAAIPNKPF